MFGLDSGKKEVFPYNYYSSTRTKENQIGNIEEASLFVPDVALETDFRCSSESFFPKCF